MVDGKVNINKIILTGRSVVKVMFSHVGANDYCRDLHYSLASGLQGGQKARPQTHNSVKSLSFTNFFTGRFLGKLKAITIPPCLACVAPHYLVKH